jgi:hypothetical protein
MLSITLHNIIHFYINTFPECTFSQFKKHIQIFPWVAKSTEKPQGYSITITSLHHTIPFKLRRLLKRYEIIYILESKMYLRTVEIMITISVVFQSPRKHYIFYSTKDMLGFLNFSNRRVVPYSGKGTVVQPKALEVNCGKLLTTFNSQSHSNCYVSCMFSSCLYCNCPCIILWFRQIYEALIQTQTSLRLQWRKDDGVCANTFLMFTEITSEENIYITFQVSEFVTECDAAQPLEAPQPSVGLQTATSG